MQSSAGISNNMFEGVRVVELAQFVFVPAAGAVLADLGAEVIKIEAITGDPYRTLRIADGRQTRSANLSMEQNNRNKKSIALDLKSPAGRELLLSLIETADIFLTSLRPGAIERLGLGVEALRARNPRLIYARGNGLGFHGKEVDRPGYDASCFWARGGFAHALTPPGMRPIRPRPALGDHAGAMNVAFGLASALYRRERTREPSLVEVSLLSSAAWILSADVTMAKALSSTELKRVGAEARFALTSAYETADGRFVQLMFLDPERYWSELCRRLGRLEWLEDPRFVDLDARIEHGDQLIDELTRAFQSQPLAVWRQAFSGWDAPWEVVQSVEELANDPQVEANDYLFDVTVGDGTPVTVVAGPVAFNGSAVPQAPRCSPALGQDTRDILRELGLGDAEIERYREQHVVTL